MMDEMSGTYLNEGINMQHERLCSANDELVNTRNRMRPESTQKSPWKH